jgi:hypothetical protein
MELRAKRVGDDNERLREMLLDNRDEWKDEKIAELEFLLGEYKKRNNELLQREQGEGTAECIR